ncbi:MAG: SDR family NAD(P)-dependent oxidoreductase, partial [Planctomycetes bacterium]|nr:SDR family NAD(P)-dependent oxidoreductase [Planctomycetota bacterium]
RSVVTGAASGIGREVARELAGRPGARLHLVDRDGAGLETLAGELRAVSAAGAGSPPVLDLHPADISSSDSVRTLAATVGDGPLDCLVNCAGVLALGPFEHTRFEDVERVIQINLTGTVRMTHAFLPALLRSPRAFIVNVASAAGLVASPGMTAYTASKFGVVGFSEALRAELRGRVGVCVVCPTFVRTGILRGATHAEGGTPGYRGETADATLERIGASPKKVSRAILKAIEKRRGLVLVNADAHAIYHLHRFFPGLTERVVHLTYRWLQRKGVLAR